ncbi:unnamed protein product, partial [Didymodactylos carnosus]
MRYNSEYEDRKTTDYGQILFPENDRRSWYIRFPFEPVLSLDQQQQIATPLVSIPTVQQLLRRTPLFPQISQRSLAWHIVQFMRTAWNLPTPELIISVTGGAKFCNLTREMRNAFQQALISAVLTTDAWIFTGGTNSGVMKEVGNAVDKCRQKTIPCIGICSWYYTTDYEQLEQNRDPTTTTDTNLSLEKTLRNSIRLYRTRQLPKSEVTESFPLDTNHTHFLLLDDMCGANDEDWKKMFSLSKEDEHKGEIPRRADLTLKLRAEIEQEARKTTDDEHKSLIPIVQILVDGGRSSILTMCEAVALRTPVIVIQVIATLDIFLDKLTAKMNGTGKGDRKFEKLKLAMAFNKYDLVTSTILTDNTRSQWTGYELNNALCDALKFDSIHFIELLLGFNASFDRCRRYLSIDEFYRCQKKSHPLPLKNAICSEENYYKTYLNQGKEYFHVHARKRYDSMEIPDQQENMLMFNKSDIVRESGYIQSISFEYDEYPRKIQQSFVWLCVLSQLENDTYQIVFSQKILITNNNSQNLKRNLYVEKDQYLAIYLSEDCGTLTCYSSTDQVLSSAKCKNQLMNDDIKNPVKFQLIPDQAIEFNFTIDIRT